MIINTGQRTDIPAYYSEWFYQRIDEGYVHVRNPYYPKMILEYQLNPQVVDCLCFCTKNPEPMLLRLDEIKAYRQFWSVTITPYGQDIEPRVPHYLQVIKSFQKLSLKVGSHAIAWRYDPILINDVYTVDKHLEVFEQMAKLLCGYTHQCVISFIDLYQKTKRNFPHVQEVSMEDQSFLVKNMVKIAKRYQIQIKTCLENPIFENDGADVSGCMSQQTIEKAIKEKLIIKKKTNVREGCSCLLGNDIGAYNTCMHGCLYCYANEDKKLVWKNYQKHDPSSSLLIGYVEKDDEIKKVKQTSWIDMQLSLDI